MAEASAGRLQILLERPFPFKHAPGRRGEEVGEGEGGGKRGGVGLLLGLEVGDLGLEGLDPGLHLW